MKIYVVTKGWYSDYHIIAVFDNEEQAKECVDFYKHDVQIEEYDVNYYDRGGVPQGMYTYEIGMLRNGNVTYADRAYIFDTDGHFHYDDSREEWALEGRVHARNEEHAIKIFGEKRTRLITANRFPYPDIVPDGKKIVSYMTIDDWDKI